ncbi:MAG: UDP-glucose/GDP-mannose dehydrogenase family protein [Bacteroidales bacterium]|nr:UDP-glucose/GDP-mannose dehydrogenase family protein [Bacteroidales bacterium]
MKIAVVGTGYVGLVSGTCFAETGIQVACVDIDKNKIKRLNQGEVPIYEPGLSRLVKNNLEKKRISFTTSLKESIVDCEAVFIAVGTPPGGDGSADLKYVIEVAREIGRTMQDYLVVITKSTVPINTSEKVRTAVAEELEKRKTNIEFDVASNPEFLKEGAAVNDFLKPDRIVVGTDSERAEKIIRRLYKPFLLNGHPIIFMDIRSSEMTKYAANAMLATKISFMNEIANLCEAVGADVNLVRKGIGSDPRIGNKFIYPGAGYGGSCFPKDVKALVRTARQYNTPLRVLQSVEDANDHQKTVLGTKVINHFGGDLKGKNIAVWGLSFKPETDDMREAPSLVVIEALLGAGANVTAYDPVATNEAKKTLGNRIGYAADRHEALLDANALVIVTEWSEFRVPNYRMMEKLMKQKIIFDGRNIYEPGELVEFGFSYHSIGRKPYLVSERKLI